MKLSIVVPFLNEAQNIVDALSALRPLRERGAELIGVDGGSSDDSFLLATGLCDRLLRSDRGRAAQQNAGAQVAGGDTLLFLHVDTRLPAHADSLIAAALSDARVTWGRFDVTLDAGDARPNAMLKVVAALMNFRSRITGVATGDQCIFVRNSTFVQAGGFPQVPLMEDIALSKALKRVSAPACLRERVSTSARRWQRNGVWRTILLMWWLRFAYWMGVSPSRIASWYR